jgi:GT2 family glycosyltransferase
MMINGANMQAQTSSNPLVYVLVLNWNAYDQTIPCVESLAQTDYPNLKIAIIDNGSTNDSEAILRSRFPEHHLIQTGSNLGYAGGNNVGIAYALEQGAEYIWILNNDTLVSPNTLRLLVNAMLADPQIAHCGPKVYYMEEPKIISTAGATIDLWRGKTLQRGAHEIDIGQFDEPAYVDYICGCCLLARSDLVRKFGSMMEDYFLYYEDTEWGMRYRAAGFKLLYLPTAQIWHREGGSSGGHISPDVIYYNVRNGLLLFANSFPFPQRITATLRFTLSNLLVLIRTYFNKRNLFNSYTQAVFAGFRDYLSKVSGPRPK